MLERCSLLVLNYNGVDHLGDCLSSALVAAERSPVPCAVVCVDNRSTDASVELIGREFPSVELIVAPENDFLFSLNAVVRERKEDVVVVLNNDMRFAPDFVAPLLEHFDDPTVFAVGAAIFNWDGSEVTVGQRCAEVRRLWFYKWWNFDRQETCLTLEACGGAAAYRRDMFVELGGFDDLYRPGYYEDLDLSFRAWERGWRVVYEPRSGVYHKESASMLRRYGADRKARLLYRNHVLFTAKNIGGPGFLAGFLALLPLRIVRPLLSGDRVPLHGGLAALPRLATAIARRRPRARGAHDFLAMFREGRASVRARVR